MVVTSHDKARAKKRAPSSSISASAPRSAAAVAFRGALRPAESRGRTGSKLPHGKLKHGNGKVRDQNIKNYASSMDASCKMHRAGNTASASLPAGAKARARVEALDSMAKRLNNAPKASKLKNCSISNATDKIIGGNSSLASRNGSHFSISKGNQLKSAKESDDDRCSVASAILEEDICFKCGSSTLNEPSWSDLILCDVCDGEFHLACAGLDVAPRSGWRCQRCTQEYLFFRKLKYEILPYFKAPRQSPIHSVCYSPSKPLAVAWTECQAKGFMVVQNIFPLELLRCLTHGRIEGVTKSGRLVGTWNGALEEIKTKIKLSCENLTDRTGRFDLKLPSFVVDSLCLEDRLKPLLLLLRSVMGQREPYIRTHNVVFVPCGSDAQPWHYDDSVRLLSHRRYFTILIPLNPIDENSGGTEIWDDYSNKTDLIRPRPGDAFVFHGGLRHRGCGNSGKTHRLFYYSSFSCGTDENVAT